MNHIPVLLNEVLRLLDLKPGMFVIDGTLNGGGYAKATLKEIAPGGKFLGIDWDKNILERSRPEIEAYSDKNLKIYLINDNFASLPEILERLNLGKADVLVLDLGFSSEQLENSERGFSFLKNQPLLMTYSDEMAPVRELLRSLSEDELAEIIKNLSQERFARRIAKSIKDMSRARSIETTGDLVEAITRAVPKNYERGRLHPATRTFLALRIYANRELENLESVLQNLPAILRSGGRVAIVSFHSLEDRTVKNRFKNLSKVGQIDLLTKKPIKPSREEIRLNPRARSASLRAAVLI